MAVMRTKRQNPSTRLTQLDNSMRRLLINASNVTSPGAESLALSLLPEILTRSDRFSCSVVMPGNGKLAETASTWIDAEIVAVKNRVPWHTFSRLWFEYKAMRFYVRKTGADAVLTLGNIAPARTRVPTTVLMQHLFIADRHLASQPPAIGRLTLAANRFLFKRTVKHTGAIIVQTNHMRDLVLENYSVAADRVYVVANNVSPTLLHRRDSAGLSATVPGDNGPIRLIYPAAPYRYKNIDLILGLASRLRENNDSSVQFVLTLDESSRPGAELLRKIHSAGLENWILNAGMTDQANLAEQYTRSSALFFPSLAESFGNPLLEAASFGLPVLAADLPYARDVMGGGAIYFNPHSVDSAFGAIEKLRDPSTWKALSVLARDHYDLVPKWPEIADRFLDIVESTLTD